MVLFSIAAIVDVRHLATTYYRVLKSPNISYPDNQILTQTYPANTRQDTNNALAPAPSPGRRAQSTQAATTHSPTRSLVQEAR